MFDISFTELMLIGVVALVVIGPERLPRVARTIGHLVGRAQRYVGDVKNDIQREMDLDQITNLKDQMEDAAKSVKTSVKEATDSLRDPLDSARKALDDAAQSVDSVVKSTRDQLADAQKTSAGIHDTTTDGTGIGSDAGAADTNAGGAAGDADTTPPPADAADNTARLESTPSPRRNLSDTELADARLAHADANKDDAPAAATPPSTPGTPL